jgi:hypothetical protein
MDFKSAPSADLQGKNDLEVLELAEKDGRILVTQDIRTMPRHFASFLQAGPPQSRGDTHSTNRPAHGCDRLSDFDLGCH